VLAVVQDQQGRRGADGAHNAADQVAGRRDRPDRPHPGLADAQGGGDCRRDVVVGGDAGQAHQVYRRLLGVAADHVGEPGLAQAAGADDRGDPGGPNQGGHRCQVVLAAEQRVGVVRDAVSLLGLLAAQQLPVHCPQRGARVGAQLVADLSAVGLVAGQCRGRTGRGGLAAQQLDQHLLVARLAGPLAGQRHHGLGRATQARQGQRARTHERPPRRQPLRAQRRDRIVEGGGLLGDPVPPRQARVRPGQRRRVIAGGGEPCALGGVGQDRGGVDLVLG
jgi:hypothetical protein